MGRKGLIAIVMLCLCSCTTQKTITERTDTIYKETHDTLWRTKTIETHDTLRSRDTITYVINEKGEVTHTREVHYVQEKSDVKDSTDYYKALYEKSKEKHSTEKEVVKEKPKWKITIANITLILMFMGFFYLFAIKK